MSWKFDSAEPPIVRLKKDTIFDQRFGSTVYIDQPLYKASEPVLVTTNSQLSPAHTHTIPFPDLQKIDRVDTLTEEIRVIRNRITELEECQDSQNKIWKEVVKGLAHIKQMVTKNRRISDDTAELIINKTEQLEEKMQYLVNEVNEHHTVFKHLKRDYEDAARDKEPI